MTEQPKDEFNLEALKYKVKLIFEGSGIKIFSSLLTILAILIIGAIIAVGYFFRNLWGLLLISIILGGAFYLVKYIFSSVISLAKNRKTQSLFFTPKEWLAMARLEVTQKFGTNKTGFKEIPEKTKLGQPQFASSERGSEITGVIIEEGDQ